MNYNMQNEWGGCYWEQNLKGSQKEEPLEKPNDEWSL